MTSPAGGGDRLAVQVVADASGFARDAQAKIDAATKDVRARIQAEIDTARLQAQAQAAARRVESQTKLQLKVGVDTRYLRESIKAALTGLDGEAYRVKIGVDIDTGRVQRALDEATHERSAKVSVDVDADTTRAKEEVDAFREEERIRPPVEVKVKVKKEKESDPLSGLSGVLGNIGSPVSGLVSGLGSLSGALMPLLAVAGPGLIGIAGAASQAIGTIGGLPAVFALAAQGAGTLFAGFSGVSKAVQALTAVDTGGALQAQAAANQRISAQQAVAAAQQNVANVAQSSSLAIAQGEQQVASAQHASLEAQLALTQARQDASNKLRDYKLQLSGAALSEQQAQLDIESAALALKQTNANPVSTDLQRRQSELALSEAQQRLAEVQQSNADLKKQAAIDIGRGVEGMPTVKNAEYAAGQATMGVSQAQAALVRTQQQNMQQAANAAQSLANAERQLAQVSASTTASQTALNAAMKNLSPAGRTFVEFLHAQVMPRLKDLKKGVQEAILPGVQAGVQGALPLLDTLKKGMEGTGTVIGGLVRQTGQLMGSPAWRGDIATIMASNNRATSSFGQAGISLLTILKDLAVAAGPMLERFAKWVQHLAAGAAASADAAKEGGKLEAFFQRAGDRAAQLGRIFGDLGKALFNIFKGAAPSGNTLLAQLESLMQRFKDWSASVSGQNAIKQFFNDLAPLAADLVKILGNLGGALGGGTGGLGKSGLMTLVSDATALSGVLKGLMTGPFGGFITGLIGMSTLAAAASKPIAAIGTGIGGIVSGVKGTAQFLGGFQDVTKATEDGATAATKIGAKFRGLPSAVGEFVTNSGIKIAGWGRAAGGAIGDVASKIGSVGKGFGSSIASAAKAGAAWAATGARSVIGAIGGVASSVADLSKKFGASVIKAAEATAAWIATNAAKAATAVVDGVLAAAEWVLNIALDANPVVLLTLAIIAVIAALVLAYEKVDWFHKLIDTVFNAIKTIIVSELQIAWALIKAFFQFLWDTAGTILRIVKDIFTGNFGDIKNAFWDLVHEAGKIWDSLKKAMRDPLDAIINVVYNNGVVPVWNWINDLWGGSDLRPYHLPQFATGGVLDATGGGAAPGYSPGNDTLLVRASPGEGFLVPEAVRGIGGRDAIQAINSHYSSRVSGPGLGGGMPGFKGGGVLDTLGNAWNGATGAVGDAWNATTGFVGNMADKFGSLLDKGWKIAVHAATLPIRAAAGAVPGNGSFADGMRAGVGMWMDKLEASVGAQQDKQQAQAAQQAGSVGGNVAQWAPLVAQVLAELGQSQASLPWVLKLIDHESSGNPLAANLTDINAQRGDPSIGLMQVIGSTFRAHAGPYVSRGQTDPHASIYAGLAYGISRYGSVMGIPGIASLATGGGYKPYDTGGRWADGTTGINTSGHDEGVLTGKGVSALGGWGRIDALNSGRPLAELVGAAAGAGARASESGQKIGTYIAEGAVQQTIHNPVPETTEQTLNTRMRRLGELGVFNGGPS